VKNGRTIIAFLFDTIESHPSPERRLLASICVANFFKADPKMVDLDALAKLLLPCLASLLDDPGIIRQRAGLVIAYLVADNQDLQLATIDCNMIGKLVKILKDSGKLELSKTLSSSSYTLDNPSNSRTEYPESAFLALAAICSSKDECRRLVWHFSKN
jgi:hypothetical protein